MQPARRKERARTMRERASGTKALANPLRESRFSKSLVANCYKYQVTCVSGYFWARVSPSGALFSRSTAAGRIVVRVGLIIRCNGPVPKEHLDERWGARYAPKNRGMRLVWGTIGLISEVHATLRYPPT